MVTRISEFHMDSRALSQKKTKRSLSHAATACFQLENMYTTSNYRSTPYFQNQLKPTWVQYVMNLKQQLRDHGPLNPTYVAKQKFSSFVIPPNKILKFTNPSQSAEHGASC